ncbi:hypothetical protein FOMPIDRAFT_1044755 [Fomitopsis schrenkii]|uniref:Uncharacterized protein n=1 Tax=Fomitopsis schrenkii TaxID=2126942 RepID=S8G5B0_FOMSC|nr:hypothetical protein FOMPIDRAFT_1044755 [Fomitopsis schrenkii]
MPRVTPSKASEQGRGSASAGQGKATKSASSTKPASTKPAAAPKKDVKAKPNAKSAAAAEHQKKKKEEDIGCSLPQSGHKGLSRAL